MKSVLVCAAQAPFITGGAEILVGELRANLERRGFRVDVAAVPFKWYPVSEIVRQALAWRLLDVTESNGRPVDLVIPTKFPSFLVRHPRKVAWLFHQHREAYDLYGSEYCSFTDSPQDQQVLQAIHSMDTAALSECRSIYTISRNVAARLGRYNNLPGTPLYPPPHHLGRYRCAEYGDFLFYAGRLDRLKRLDLAVDALRRVKGGARLLIAGKSAGDEVSVKITAARSPPASEPQKVQLRRPTAMPRTARSAALLVMQMRPSSRKRVNVLQRFRL